jgi:transcriptional regulator with XRE-family HTH domain
MTAIKCETEMHRINRLRPMAGAWLSALRKSAEITAAELAEQVGVGVDLIEACENGAEKVPAALYRDFARALVVDFRNFAKSCLMYDNPCAYEALFGALPEDCRIAA